MVRKAREWEHGFSGCADRGSQERGDWKCALISSINSLWHCRFPAFWSYQVNSTSVVPHLKNGDTELSAFLCLEQKCSIGVSLDIMLGRYTATKSPRALWAILRILCFPVVQRKSIKVFNGWGVPHDHICVLKRAFNLSSIRNSPFCQPYRISAECFTSLSLLSDKFSFNSSFGHRSCLEMREIRI